MDGNDDPFRVFHREPMSDQKDAVMADGLYGRAGLFREPVPGFDPRFEKGIVLYKPSDTLLRQLHQLRLLSIHRHLQQVLCGSKGEDRRYSG